MNRIVMALCAVFPLCASAEVAKDSANPIPVPVLPSVRDSSG